MGRQIRLEKVIDKSISKGNDLESLIEFTKNQMSEIDCNPRTYVESVTDEYLNWYNKYMQHRAFRNETEEKEKLFSRKKALWRAYKKVYTDGGMKTCNWTFDPRQKSL